MKVAQPAFLMAVVLHLVSAPDLRADLIAWTYSWSNSPSVIEADVPGTGAVSLTNESSHLVVGNSNVVATNLKTSSTATDANPATFTDKSYTLNLLITDNTSGQSGTLTFTGVLNGTLTQTNSYLRNTFTGPITQQLVLGTNLYTVTIGPYSPPGPPGDPNAGSVSSYAAVNVVQLVATPEPSTWVMSLLGFVALLGYGARHLRRTPYLIWVR